MNGLFFIHWEVNVVCLLIDPFDGFSKIVAAHIIWIGGFIPNFSLRTVWLFNYNLP